MSSDELRYRIAFASIRGMGVSLARQLLEVTGSERAFFEMSEQSLRGLTQGHSKVYGDSYRRQQLERADRELEFIVRNNITTTYFADEAIRGDCLRPTTRLACSIAAATATSMGAI